MSFFIPLLIGCAAGTIAAWGIGGGTLLLLCMTLFLNIDQSAAQSINLAFFLPTAAIALLYHRKNGYLKAEVLKRAIPWGVAAAVAAAFAARCLDTAVLRKPFGVFLLLSGVSLLLQSRKRKKADGGVAAS